LANAVLRRLRPSSGMHGHVAFTLGMVGTVTEIVSN
jgi:hypothetical protein